MNKWIIVYGDPLEGYTFVGPFDTQQNAIDYAAIDGVDESHVEALWVPETQGQNHEHA
jgi:hypothetical protein